MASGGNYFSLWYIYLIAILPSAFSQSIVHFLNEPFIGWAPSYTDAIELSCGISDDFKIGSGHEVIWRRGTDPLFTNRDPTDLASDDGRMSIIEPNGFNFTLKIINPNYTDSNTYQCALEGTFPPSSPRNREVRIGVFYNESAGCSIKDNVVTGWANDTCPKSTLHLKNSTGSVIAQTFSDEFTYNTSCSSSSLSSQIVQYDQYVAARDGVLTLYVEQDQSVVVYTKVCEVTVESTTTADPTTDPPTGNPITGSTTVKVDDPPTGGLSDGAKIGLGIGGGCCVIILIGVGAFLGKKYYQPGSGKKYNVIVYTGDICGAGTDANVFLTIFGEKGDTGERKLVESETNLHKFERNQVDKFNIEGVDLGKVFKVKIRLDNSMLSPAWFLDKVEVIDTNDDNETYVFHCERWLGKNKDDGKIECILYVEGYKGDMANMRSEPFSKSPQMNCKQSISEELPEGPIEKGQASDYHGQEGHLQGQHGDYRGQGSDYGGQGGQHRGYGVDYHRQDQPHVMYDNASNVTKIPIGNYRY